MRSKKKQVDREEKLLSLLPDAGEHVRRMEELLAGAGDKMAALEEQWQLVKQPLEDEYQQLVAEKERSGATRLRQELQDTVQDLRLVLDETRSKGAYSNGGPKQHGPVRFHDCWLCNSLFYSRLWMFHFSL